MPLNPICQAIDNEIKGLQEDLQQAGSSEKSAIVNQIKKLKKELQQCVKKHPYVPPAKPPPAKPNPCLMYKKQIDDLYKTRTKEINEAVGPLQDDLKDAGPSQKPAIVRQIMKETAEIKKKYAPKIADKQKQYNDCIIGNGGKLALDATFKGKATLRTSNENAKGPFTQDITIGLWFGEWFPGWDHREVKITSFPSISVTYDTHSPAGTVTTTVSYIGSNGGVFDLNTNTIGINLSLFFHHSTSLAGDSRLDIALLTTSPLTAGGKITLGGVSHFKEGYLNDDTCWITVSGTISPHP